VDAGLLLLIVGGVLAASIVVALGATRAGVPSLVAFLGLGMLLGSDGLGGIEFDDADVARKVGVVALAAILFEGGWPPHGGDCARLPSRQLCSARSASSLPHSSPGSRRMPCSICPGCSPCSSAQSFPRRTRQRCSPRSASPTSDAASPERSYADGHTETYEEGDAYYAPPGHTPQLFAGSEVVEFHSTEELAKTMEVVEKNMEAMSQ
jgi:hypothetical protein